MRERPFLADFLSLAGMLVYAALMWNFAHSQYSVLDEGLYLYKGWLLASGQYVPFQDNGLWMNQMPLSYLIPGWFQVLFGAGLRTGRMLAFVLSLFAILGFWLTARRLGGRWAALAVVWALALNPSAARMSALAASQGLIACLLAWTLFLTLGSDRKWWQLFLGGLLAGAVVMVRINLVLLLPLLGLYRLLEGASHLPSRNLPLNRQSQNGAEPVKPGATHFWGAFWLVAGMLITFGGTHLLYWPNILRLWARWLPLPFLSAFFAPENQATWQPEPVLGLRLASFFLAFRAHFAALIGALAALVFWPINGKMKNERTAIFLAVFFLSSFVLHAWAALGNDYCVFCFQTYTTFYSGAGLLLVAATLPDLNLNPPGWRKWLGGLALLALLGGMGYSTEGLIRAWLPENFYKQLLALPLPGFNGAEIWQVFANKFRLEYQQISDAAQAYFPVAVAVAFGLVVFVVVKLLMGRQNGFGAGFVVLTLMGTLFAPSPLIAGEYQAYDCPADVIPGYEAAGAALAQVIPPGSKVYWAGYSPVTLLYLPGIEILPGQLHGGYSFRVAADDAAIRRYGWWNQSLAEHWLAEADFVLVERRNLDREDWVNGQLTNFELVTETAPQSCLPESAMLVFRRK